MKGHLRAASALACVALLTASSVALGDPTKDQCVDANTKGQGLQGAGKLADARLQFHTCAAASCPAIVRSDCTTRLDQIDRIQPSMVFDVKDSKGADLVDVRVSADGQVLTEHLDGKPLNVDPGLHSFTFEVAGQPAVSEQLLVKEGDAGRREHVVLGAAAGAVVPAGSPPAVVAGPASPSASSPWRTVGWILGGVGVAGLGVGAITGILAMSDKSSAHCNSSDECESGPLNSAKSMAHVSDVGFIAGGALLAGGAALVLFGPPRPSAKETGAASLEALPMVGRQGGGFVLGGRF
jgi:hypothetical protein